MEETGKSLPPTQRKLKEARKKGQVPHYRELLPFVCTGCFIIVVVFLTPVVVKQILSFARLAMVVATGPLVGGDGQQELLYLTHLCIDNFLAAFFKVSATAVVPCFVAGAFAGAMANGFLFTPYPLKPSLDRISPFEGARRMFSSERWFALFKDLLKFTIAGTAGVLAMTKMTALIVGSIYCGSASNAGVIVGRVVRDFFLYSVVGILPIIVIDFVYARVSFMKKMMMSHQELKKELRETEGDPSLRGQRRRLHREIASYNMIEDVKKATLVVVNPEHIAVALRWDEATMDAPVVVASGRDYTAGAILRQARMWSIPVVRDVTVARQLVELQIGEEIPPRLYEAVAKLISFIKSPAGRF